MFKDIRQLEAGHCIKVTENSVAVRKYWDLDFPETMHTDEDEIIREMMRILRASVKRMLRSDVPLGAFLSGGVDSSSLVSLICENSAEPLKTFSVGFKEDTYDESRFAGLAANHFNTEHFRTVCRPQDVIEALPKLAWYADNLLADPAMLPLYLVSRMAKAHVTVCISGDGEMNYSQATPLTWPIIILGAIKGCHCLLENLSLKGWREVCRPPLIS